MSNLLQVALLNINAVTCAMIAVRIFLWRMTHRPANTVVSVMNYFLIISCAAVTIRTLTGDYYHADWSEAFINIVMCLMAFRWSGNLFQNGENHENHRAGP